MHVIGTFEGVDHYWRRRWCWRQESAEVGALGETGDGRHLRGFGSDPSVRMSRTDDFL